MNEKMIKWVLGGFLATCFAYLGFTVFYPIGFDKNNTQQAIISFSPPAITQKDITAVPHVVAEGNKVPEEWIEKIHKAAPGDDWRSIEAQSIRQLLAAKTKRINRELEGQWTERGPSNIPGRIVDIEIDYTSNTMYAQSDHGIIFRSEDLEGINWTPLNDQHPLGLDVASQLEVFEDGNIVSAGWIKVDNFWGVYVSNDGGDTWNKSTGFSGFEITGIKRMLRHEDELYIFMQEYDFNQVTDYYVVYKSVDHGQTFSSLYQSPIPVGDGGRHRKSDMWISNDMHDPNLYLMLEDSLFFVDKTTGSRSFNSLVSQIAIEQGLLTGLAKNGVTELTAYIASEGIGKFYAWNSTDQQWTFTGEMVDWWLALPFGSNSFSCSKLSADTLYFGGILTSKSTDRGATWTTMDLDSTASYALYHGDVPKTFTTLNPISEKEEVYLGTDGGIYKMDANEHFNSISIPGLHCTQIYKMTSIQTDPGVMYIGTQDNGYAHTSLGEEQPEIADFIFQWGGDVTNVVSGDGGETFWLWWLGDGCNYMNGTDQVVSTWSPYDFAGGIPYWEPPVWISNHHPDRCFTAGFLDNNSGNYLIELQANPGNAAIPKQHTYDFETEVGGKISAIAISPLDSNYFYVTTENGYFASSTDGGNSWDRTLLSNSMYPRVIHPSQQHLGEVWIGGSGYSNSPVFYSTDNGSAFSNLNAGLPSCRVEAFATNEEESHIFAATSIGPFVYDVDEAKWSDISGTDAPLVQYMDVEFITSSNTVRFATYARGVWDFQWMETTAVHSASNPNDIVSVYPNPVRDQLTIRSDERLTGNVFQIISSSGQVVQTGKISGENMQMNIADLSSGVYFLTVQDASQSLVKFIKQ